MCAVGVGNNKAPKNLQQQGTCNNKACVLKARATTRHLPKVQRRIDWTALRRESERLKMKKVFARQLIAKDLATDSI